MRREAAGRHEDPPGYANVGIGELLSEVRHQDERIALYDRHIHGMACQCTVAQRSMQFKGIGKVSATAIVAKVANAADFDRGRQLAAWSSVVASDQAPF